jgi:hypothetical protein
MDTFAALILIILMGIFMFLPIRWVVRVTICGKGLFLPNWVRADRKMREKHNSSFPPFQLLENQKKKI